MAKKKGKNKYVPPSVLQELENIKDGIKIPTPSLDTTAFNIMAENSRIGRQLRKKKII